MQCRLRLYHDTTNHTEILIELSHQYTHLALIMSLMIMKILANMIYMRYHPI